jgi:4-hydroxybenzoate polyprenyltransferase
MADTGDLLARLAPSDESLVGYLFWVSRPRFWLYLAGPLLVGVVYAANSPDALWSPLVVGLFVYFLLPANVFLYGINDIFDADIDAENPKKSDEGKEVQYGGNRSVVIAVGLAALIGVAFLPTLSVPAGAALGGFLLLGAAYSVPPVRFKTTPLLDSASNGLYVLPAVVGFTAVAGSLPPLLAIAGGWVWAMGMHTFSAIPDIEPDRAAGIRTTATMLGEAWTLAYCAGCWIVAAVAMGLVHPAFVAVFAIYPLFVGLIAFQGIAIDRAYWWFPAVNSAAGAVLTMGGIWVMLYG